MRNQLRHRAIRTDFTPFVDVALLLIVFFFLLKLLAKPNMQSFYASTTLSNETHEGGFIESCFLGTNTLSLYLSENHIVVCTDGYSMDTKHSIAFSLNTPTLTKFLTQQQKINPEKVVFVIKPLSSSYYKDLVDTIDLLHICKIRRYAFVSAAYEEEQKVKEFIACASSNSTGTSK